jgi:pimeloyl-ACP methyl ester carboxylesterase
MKNSKLLKSIFFFILCLLQMGYAIAQTGISRATAFEAGSLYPGAVFTNTQNNAPGFADFTGSGPYPNGIFYKFTLTTTTVVSISTCTSLTDTYLKLLDNAGNTLFSNDDAGPLCASLQASIRRSLSAGTYYVVANAWYGNWDPDNASDIITSISTPSIDYVKTTDSLIQYLDKSRLTTTILYDRAFNMANVQAFNITRADTCVNKHFRQAYKEMFDAAYNKQNWLPPTIVSQIAQGKALAKATVPMAIANYRFNVIDTNALVNGTIIQRDSLYYDASPTSNPYKTLSTLMISPLVDSVASDNNTITYTFSPELYVNQSNLPLITLRVNFGNGGADVNVPVNSNFTTAVNYSTSGFKTIRLIARFSNGSVKVTYALIKVKVVSATALRTLASTTCDKTAEFDIWSTIPFQGYDEAIASMGKGNVKIFYATNGACDGILRKPIIVVDGFDPLDTRSADKLYAEFLDNPNKAVLATDLRAQGYDIVVLNFPTYIIGYNSFNLPISNIVVSIPITRDGGADYIERNAMVLVALINRINTLKQGTEKLTIIGPSMGGLISRYALAYMEKNSMPHKTKLWVSFDSPHKGANIAIGDQYFLDFFASKGNAAEESRDKKISSVAAKQMLVHHFLADSWSVAGAPGFRDRFQTALDAMGFPKGDIGQPFRKISLIDGNTGGIQLNTGCQKGFTMDARQLSEIRTFFNLIRIAKFRTFTLASAKMYFSPNGGNICKVFEGWSIPSGSSTKFAATPNNTTAGYDTAPGGTVDTQQILQNEATGETDIGDPITWAGKFAKWLIKGFWKFETQFYSVIPTHSFINTKSALAFRGTNQDLAENISTRNLVCTSETPFDSYFADFTQNREHVALWPEAVDWVKKEINGIVQPSSTIIPNAIVGPFNVCGPTTYSIPNINSFTSVKWLINSSTLTIPANSTGNTVVVSGIIGNGTLSANVTTECGMKTLTLGLIVSATPVVPPDQNNFRVVALASRYLLNIDVYRQGTSSYQAVQIPYFNVQNLRAFRQNNTSIPVTNNVINYEFWSNTTAKIRLEYNLPCGAVTQFLDLSLVNRPPRGLSKAKDMGIDAQEQQIDIQSDVNAKFNIYPNPANSKLIISYNSRTISKTSSNKITLESSVELASNTNIFEIILYNDKGKRITQQKNETGNNDITLNTQNLPIGTYFLHIIDGNDVIKKQIVIQH